MIFRNIFKYGYGVVSASKLGKISVINFFLLRTDLKNYAFDLSRGGENSNVQMAELNINSIGCERGDYVTSQ